MKKPFLILGFLFTIIVILSLAHVVVSNSLSTTGIVLSKLQKQIDRYKKENSLLAENVLMQSSFTEIASRAAEMGFVHAKSHVYLSSPLPIAVHR